MRLRTDRIKPHEVVRRLMQSTITAITGVCIGLLLSQSQEAIAQDYLILRNLTLISGRPVESFDVDGVRLVDGEVITWDRIEKAKLESLDQQEFQRLHDQLSEPLFRIRLRLQNGDDQQVLELAENMFPIYRERRGELSRLVAAALVRGHTASGNREQAVTALLHYVSRNSDVSRSSDKDGSDKEGSDAQGSQKFRFLNVDTKTGICESLMPVWFDSAQAKIQLPFLIETLANVGTYPREFHIYTGSLALAAEDRKNAEMAVKALSANQSVQADFRVLLQARFDMIENQSNRAIDRLKNLIESETPHIRALALYWSGVARATGSARGTAGANRERMRAALTLLRITASYGDRFPDLSAAALFEASNLVGSGSDDNDPKSNASQALRQELMRRYPNSWHGQLLKRMAASK